MPKIRSIKTIDQYRINNGEEVLLTIVGEIHDEETDCSSQQVRIADVIEERMRINKSLLFLEFAPGLDRHLISRMGSTLLRDIYTTDLYPLCSTHGFGIDIRTHLIGRENQTILYNRPDFADLKELVKDRRKYRSTFLEPFLKCYLIEEIKKNDFCLQNPIIQESIRLLQKKYLRVAALLITFSSPYKEIELFNETRVLWADLMDLNILYYSLCKDFKKEIFVVVGMNHSENIKNILSSIIDADRWQHLSGCVDTGDLW